MRAQGAWLGTGPIGRWAANQDCEIILRFVRARRRTAKLRGVRPLSELKAEFYFAPLSAVKYSTIAPTSSGAIGAL